VPPSCAPPNGAAFRATPAFTPAGAAKTNSG
jgi:hypothetical protein